MDVFSIPRKVPTQNIVPKLFHRQMYGCRLPGTTSYISRQFYQNVFPNFTVINIEKPPCFLRKFSPDGKHLIAFSADQTCLEVYQYRGAQAAGDLLQLINQHNLMKEMYDGHSLEIKTNIFSKFFKLKHVVNVTQHESADEKLNREFSLFTSDGRYVIVGSATGLPDTVRAHFYEIYTSNDSVTPNPRSPLEDYTVYLIDLQLGQVCDTCHFRVDKIFMSNNQGIYMYNNILAILSVQHQVVHIFKVMDGKFFGLQSIGRFCFEDDALHFYSVFPLERVQKDKHISSLKQRILSFLYRRACSMESPREMCKFYQYFESIMSLRIWKMQLLDENHILLKYSSEDVVTQKSLDANNEPAFFVFYDISESQVLAIYENISGQLCELFENFADSFRNTHIYNKTKFACRTNNVHSRVMQLRFKQSIVRAIHGGRTQAVKRLLAQLPISSQIYSGSPYLDLSLFSYDDKWVSVIEKPKECGDYPVRFYGRDSGLLKFRIYTARSSKPHSSTTRNLVAFIFHPTDPFAISVQRTNSEYIVNIHVRFDVSNGNPTDYNNVLNFYNCS